MADTGEKSTTKSKLDALSKEDLLKFTKKLSELVKQNKETIEQLKSENGTLKEQVKEHEKCGKRAEIVEGEMEGGEVNEENFRQMKRTIDEYRQKEEKINALRRRELDDLEASRTMCSELRSQLDDARAEVTAMRDARTSANVFERELADYEKRMIQLDKEVKEMKVKLETETKEKADISEALRKSEEENKLLSVEHEKVKKELSELSRRTNEDNQRMVDLEQKMESSRTKNSRITEDFEKERIALAEQLSSCHERASRLEEIVESLREENKRLRTDREAAEARAEDIERDYESFKNRARYVLDQKTKEADEEPKIREEVTELQKKLADVQANNESMRKTHRINEEELTRTKEIVGRLENEKKSLRREAEDNALALAKALDELRVLRSDVERATEESTMAKRQLANVEENQHQLRTLQHKMSLEFEEQKSVWEKEKEELSSELSEERRRREEAVRQLEERRTRDERVVRAAPIAAVYPHFSETSVDRPPSVTSSFHRLEDAPCEKTLEDVLFGEEDNVLPIGDLPHDNTEVNRLKRLLQHTKGLLHESEEACGRLVDQTTLLKEEIRRLERNEERKNHVENTEYLKNVVLKFISPEKVSGERAQLIPILSTMLRLSREELALVQECAICDKSEENANSSSWGGYFHRWSGLS